MKSSPINDEIIRSYATEDSVILARRLGITVNNLRRKAARLGIKKKRVIVTNEIVDEHKLCPKCSRILPVYSFNRDKYQANGFDYWCRECRHKMRFVSNKTVLKDSLKNNDSINKSMAFGIKKNRNPVFKRIDSNGNEVDMKTCKVCRKDKLLEEFHYADKAKGTRKNICKLCLKDKRTQS